MACLGNMEEWRDIRGYEGIYQVSNEGRVRSLMYGKIKVLKIRRLSSKHIQIQLHKDGISKFYRVHRLVAEAFIPNPNNYTEVHHIDENPENNRVENLKWITHQEHREKHSAKLICQYTLDGKLVKVWKSLSEAERNGFYIQCICACCRGKRKTHKGFIWKYAEAL